MVRVVDAVTLAVHPHVALGQGGAIRAAVVGLVLDEGPAVVEQLALEVEAGSARARRNVAVGSGDDEASAVVGARRGVDRRWDRGRDGGRDARHDRSNDTFGYALERADGGTDEIEARARDVSHPEYLAPRSAALDPAAGLDGTNRGEGYLEEEHRGGPVAGRGRLLSLSTAVGGGVGGQRERHAAAGFVGGWFHGAVAGDFFDTRARDLELARRIKHRAPVTPVVVVEDPRAEHDGQDDAFEVDAAFTRQSIHGS